MPPVTPPPQATVRRFDPVTRSGSVLFDDGAEMPFDATAFDRGGLLTLRLGQRVRLALTRDGPRTTIVALTIVTVAFPPGVEDRAPLVPPGERT